MAPSEQARNTHDELFPGHVATLAVTDPELTEVFDNFAFDEVQRDSGRDRRWRLRTRRPATLHDGLVRSPPPRGDTHV